jgi:fucose permease
MTSEKSTIRSLRIGFFTLSISYLVYAPRIPDLKDRLNVSVSTLGSIFMIVGLMGLLTSRLVSIIVKKYTSKKSIVMALPLTMGGSILLGSTTAVPVFILGLIILAFGVFLINTSVNTQASNVREVTGTNQLSNLSAIANIGSLVALVIGSIFLSILTTPQYIIGLQALVTVIFLGTYRNLLPVDNNEGTGDKAKSKLPWFTKDQIQFWIIVFILFASTTAEFSVSDWAAIMARDDFKIKAPLYLAPFIVFQAGIIISRFALNGLSAKFTEISVVRFSAMGAAVLWGASIQLASHLSHTNQAATIAAVLIGFFVAGCGVGPVWPAHLTSATKSHYPVPDVLARLFSFLSLAFVFGPGVIAALSKAVSLSTAMMVPVAALFVVGLLSKRGLHHP